MALNVEGAIARLRERWGSVHLDVRASVASVSDQSSATRAFPSHAAPQPKVFEAPSLALALAAALKSAGLEE